MTRITAVLALVMVSACAPTPPQREPYNLEMAQNDCAIQNAPFILLGGCLESQMQKHAPEWVIRPDADLLGVYFSWLSAAGNRVAIEEMTEEDGRRQASELLARLKTIEKMRQAAVRQQAITNALTGFAIMQSATPQPLPPLPPASIACTTGPVNPVYGTQTTTCR
jgi:hypothetical protein